MLTRLVLVSVAAAALVLVAVPQAARATGGGSGSGSGGIWGNVDCSQQPYAGCQMGAGTGGTVDGTGSSAPPTGGLNPSGSGGGSDAGPDPFSCLDDLVPYVPPAGALTPPAGQTASDGAWYVSICGGPHAGMPGGGVFYPPVWVPNGPNPPPRVTPAQLARSAYNNLALPRPTVELSPVGRQLVNLPTWLAVTGGWDERSATAGVPAAAGRPAVSVTASARPTKVVWDLGDGSRLTCDGPGTVFAAGDDPALASPTCGHTYRTSSASRPGGVFVVTVTVHWSITWAGAGQGGAFPDLTTAATVPVSVAESPALATD